MPLYEYQCKKCKHKFEKIRKFSDPPIRKCPECGGPVEQLLHAPAVQFKGSGWYVTDYGGKKSEATSDGASEKKETTGTKETTGAKDGGAKDKDTSAKDKDTRPQKAETKKHKE